jgi:hypothetical protein
MATYLEHRGFFERELASLGAKPLHLDIRTFLSALGPVDYPHMDEANDACRTFARTLVWPPLTDPLRLEVCLRLDCARWYCDQAVRRGQQEEDEGLSEEDGREFLESLLIEYWLDVGRSDWLWENYVLHPDDLPEFWKAKGLA